MTRFGKELYGLFGCKNCRQPLSEHVKWKCIWAPTHWEWVFQPNAQHFKWAREHGAEIDLVKPRVWTAYIELRKNCNHQDGRGKLLPQPSSLWGTLVWCDGCNQPLNQAP